MELAAVIAKKCGHERIVSRKQAERVEWCENCIAERKHQYQLRRATGGRRGNPRPDREKTPFYCRREAVNAKSLEV